MLEHIGLRHSFIEHVNKHFGIQEGLQKLELNLNDLGLVEGSKKGSDSSNRSFDISKQSEDSEKSDKRPTNVIRSHELNLKEQFNSVD